MGRDKATMVVAGEPLATRLARVLGEVADLVVEVGPGRTGCTATSELPPGAGPLAAVAAGRAALLEHGLDAPALVCACDLPAVGPALLELLARWPGTGSVLPVVEGREQPLCARWSREDLDAAGTLLGSGERSLRSVPSRDRAVLLGEDAWSAVATAADFVDLDTPEDLDAYDRARASRRRSERLGPRDRRGPPRR